jgi:hypothetical protein
LSVCYAMGEVGLEPTSPKAFLFWRQKAAPSKVCRTRIKIPPWIAGEPICLQVSQPPEEECRFCMISLWRADFNRQCFRVGWD